MKSDSRVEKHFFKKKRHTEIKHYIFQDVLKNSLYIANMLARNESFTYIDLFAGRGDFEDQREGSPVLAFNIIEQHVLQDQGPGRNRFHNARIIAIDKDMEAVKHLEEILVAKLNRSSGGDRGLEVYTGSGNWESHDSEIREFLSQSRWGFIFADPFSTELDIDRLKATIRAYASYKDILILTNAQTASRQAARGHPNDIARVSRSLGISPEQVEGIAGSRENFVRLLKLAFSSIKEFTIGVAIPVTVAGKLINADYFYLVLATNSIVVADSFLTAYERMVLTEKNMPESFDFFPGEEILKAFTRNKTKTLSLWQIMENHWDNFLSWKRAMTDQWFKIPTIKNTVEALNILRSQNKIVFQESELFQYKTNRNNAVPGDLKYSEIKNGQNTKQIKIQLNE
jgi:three-Cys-motif partner protein